MDKKSDTELFEAYLLHSLIALDVPLSVYLFLGENWLANSPDYLHIPRYPDLKRYLFEVSYTIGAYV